VEAGDHGEDAALLTSPQARLKAHHVPHLARAILASQLHDRPWTVSRPRIRQADRLHRPEAQGLVPS